MSIGLLFDMDGVLLDTSRSYRAAILETARKVTGVAPPSALNLDLIETFKRRSGFNNDWHLCAALVELLESDCDLILDRNRLEDCLDEASERGGGLTALREVLGLEPGPLPDSSPMHPLVAQFQAIYLGRALFLDLHGTCPPPPHLPEEGLIDMESALVGSRRLSLAAARYRLGIATGRPSGEARYALKRHGLSRYFSAVIAHDDIRAAREAGDMNAEGKPSPWSLLEAKRRMQLTECVAYLGDLPDDIRAARAAGMPGVGIGGTPRSRSALVDAGAVETFQSTDDALHFVLEVL